MDAPIRDGEAILERGHSRTRKALADLVAMAVNRGIPWPAVARHPLAARPWELIPMIPDRAARADAYRSEIHYAEQTAAALRTRRGAWLGQVLDAADAPTKIALAGELGCSRPTLDKWLDKGAVAV
ncbi:hypothetical protein EV383_4439 [Pseudonocardia sediminis]|uniref:Uncharacterized protein n=2 Tax=Pseudonocardia sediminis TaxID=1397368 RepID=A0A4Q7V210_PSEST|nr:hypothetical protein EV383_4439 [Pseudonocardia sediminis]